MNKTVNVNIGGIVFHIDENAYERFKQYLESIRSHFSSSEGRDEIMQDIESRIAEMFQERIHDQKEVITLLDVAEVTLRMGKPEQFGDEEKKETREPELKEKIQRRMFRNPDDKLLGGVCSGLGAYFDIDPVWIRLILAFSFFYYGTGFMLYLILWIILPKAITTADKLQMKGEPVTIGNIEKNVQEEIGHVKKKVNEVNEGGSIRNFISKLFNAFAQIAKMIFLIAGKLFAIVFIFIGLLMVFVIFASFLALFKFPGTQYPEVLNQIFPTGFQFGFALIAVLIVLGLPFIMLAYYGARNLFNIRKSTRILNYSALALWLAAGVVCIILGVSIAGDFREKQSIQREIDLVQPASSTLHLKLNGKSENSKKYDSWDEDEWNGDLRLSLNDGMLQSKDIKMDIVKSENDSFHLTQICYARGSSKKTAADHATRISYSFNQADSVLSLDPFFLIEKNEKYRVQKIQLILHVPVGRKIYIDHSMRSLIYDIENSDNILDKDMVQRTWEMKADGLKCIDCTGEEASIGSKERNSHFYHNGRVHITDDGVYIKGSDGTSLTIDSNGVIIHEKGKTKVIKKGKIDIKSDENNKEW